MIATQKIEILGIASMFPSPGRQVLQPFCALRMTKSQTAAGETPWEWQSGHAL
jgi:hypothetical protein